MQCLDFGTLFDAEEGCGAGAVDDKECSISASCSAPNDVPSLVIISWVTARAWTQAHGSCKAAMPKEGVFLFLCAEVVQAIASRPL